MNKEGVVHKTDPYTNSLCSKAITKIYILHVSCFMLHTTILEHPQSLQMYERCKTHLYQEER